MKSVATPRVLSADACIDLQLHTIYSDGTWTPEQLMDYLLREQFSLVAITDHDRVDTAAALQQLAVEKQLTLLTAVEMSTSWRGELTDVLCYGFDPQQNELQDLTQAIACRQGENTREVCENLRKIGIAFPQDELDVLLAKPSAQQPHELVTLVQNRGSGTGEPSAGTLITDAGFFGLPTILQPLLTRPIAAGRYVFSLILDVERDSPAMMSMRLMSCEGRFPLMAWRSIIPPTPQSR